jgi:hypothetical protein
VQLQALSPYYIESCFKDGIKFISKIFLEILFNSSIVKQYNIHAVENLRLDIKMLDDYFNNLNINHPGFNECLMPIKHILMIFFERRTDQFLQKQNKYDHYYDIKIEDLCRFLARYKNLKKSSEMKGKISENDLSGFIKKLKEIK